MKIEHFKYIMEVHLFFTWVDLIINYRTNDIDEHWKYIRNKNTVAVGPAEGTGGPKQFNQYWDRYAHTNSNTHSGRLYDSSAHCFDMFSNYFYERKKLQFPSRCLWEVRESDGGEQKQLLDGAAVWSPL